MDREELKREISRINPFIKKIMKGYSNLVILATRGDLSQSIIEIMILINTAKGLIENLDKIKARLQEVLE